jgi:hypothetical protein
MGVTKREKHSLPIVVDQQAKTIKVDTYFTPPSAFVRSPLKLTR